MVFKLFAKLSSRLSKLVSHFSGIFVVILVILALICLFITQEKEGFIPGKAGPVHPYQVTEQTSQQLGLPNTQCTPETDCFPGNYLRTEIYQNVCPPKYGVLNREKIQLVDDCQRNLGKPAEVNIMGAPNKFYCDVDQHLNRHCFWGN